MLRTTTKLGTSRQEGSPAGLAARIAAGFYLLPDSRLGYRTRPRPVRARVLSHALGTERDTLWRPGGQVRR